VEASFAFQVSWCSSEPWLNEAVSRKKILAPKIWGQCYGHYFRQFLPFLAKNGVLIETHCCNQFYAFVAVNLVVFAYFFANYLGENILKIITSAVRVIWILIC
jgi:hypothetical protein